MLSDVCHVSDSRAGKLTKTQQDLRLYSFVFSKKQTSIHYESD
jgi:hypothetical protein